MKIRKWLGRFWKRDRAWLEHELLLSLTDPQGALREAVLRVVRGVAKDVAGEAMEPVLERALQAFDAYVEQHTTAPESPDVVTESSDVVTVLNPIKAKYLADQHPWEGKA